MARLPVGGFFFYIVEKLNKEVNAALADPKMKARLADLDGTVLGGSPAEFGKLIAKRNREVGQGDPSGQHQTGVRMTAAALFRRKGESPHGR